LLFISCYLIQFRIFNILYFFVLILQIFHPFIPIYNTFLLLFLISLLYLLSYFLFLFHLLIEQLPLSSSINYLLFDIISLQTLLTLKLFLNPLYVILFLHLLLHYNLNILASTINFIFLFLLFWQLTTFCNNSLLFPLDIFLLCICFHFVVIILNLS